MQVRSILVINSKGGSGKSTLAANLANHYAVAGLRTALYDFDRQMSGMRWLEQRPDDAAPISGTTGWEFHDIDAYERAVIDAPAHLQKREMAMLVARSDVVVIPVLPAPVDIRAVAGFIRELLIDGKVRYSNKPVCVVANRVGANTAMYEQLCKFLDSLGIPLVATLDDSHNYATASLQGLGIFDLPADTVARDLECWRPLVEWIDGHFRTSGALRRSSRSGDRPPLKLVQ